jgi:ribosome recycling factor
MTYTNIDGERIKQHLQSKLSVIHTGRVNSSVLDQIQVEAYGSKLKVQELATITVPEPAQLLITPFDKSVNQAIAKAISESNLGVNPVDDGAGIRLNFPPLTEETRKERVKTVNKLLEEARVEVRRERQDLLKMQKHEKEEGNLSEDEYNRFENDLQKEVDTLNNELEKMAQAKEKELLTI